MKQGPRGEAGEITCGGVALNKSTLLQESWIQAKKDECEYGEVTRWWGKEGQGVSRNKAG